MVKVVVGLSGGVDSAVAAHLLKKQGHEVIGMFMKNWHDESVTISDECPWVEDSADALMVAEKLGIPYQVIDLSKPYKKRIVEYMFEEYQNGRTPNPDVLCNREIKFDLFLKAALKLGADYVATGHHCQKEEIKMPEKDPNRLLAGKDPGKDQSYFLCQLTQEQLKYALFPIGGLFKSEVREIARAEGLHVAEKKDSQGLCFVGKVKLPVFLQQQLKPKRGKIIDIPENSPLFAERENSINKAKGKLPKLKAYSWKIPYKEESGNESGFHQGAHYFTIGQRKGLNIGGRKEPVFVIHTDTKTNTTFIGEGENHPGLFRKGLFIENEDIHWLRKDLEMKNGEEMDFLLRIRYRQKLQKARIYKEKTGMYVVFEQEQKSITPGQFAAWYLGKELIGSGVIA
jgi:tRNA-uridine 2-sulfurtransferase